MASVQQGAGLSMDQLLVSLRSNPQPQIRLAAMNSLLREVRAAASLAKFDPHGKEIRANAFRILRHVASAEGVYAVRRSMTLGIDIFIVRALSRDNRFDLEREQAIKLVRAFLEIEGAVKLLSTGLVRVLVALAENPEDKLRIVALETICEIAIWNVELVAECGGIRVIVGSLCEVFGRTAVGNVVVSTVVYLMDSESTRKYLRPEVELEALSQIVQSENKEVAALATVLASEIQKLSSTLPSRYASNVQSLSSLFGMASNFSNEANRHFATEAFTHIDSFYEKETTIPFSDVKEVIGGQIEDAQFKLTVAEAEKIFTKDSSKWNWDFIHEFLQILLNNSRRADDVLKNTKILKRLLSFYKPIGSGFVNAENVNLDVMTTTGLNLMKVLLSCNEGVKLLTESKFMIEVADEFSKLDQINGPLPPDALFSQNRVENNFSGLYFNFLAELSHSPSGVSILNRFKIFNMCYLITELHNREDLIKAMISAMDFSKEGHERVILGKLTTCSEKEIRNFSTNFVGNLLLLSNDESMTRWCVEVLVTQIYDPNKDVRIKAKTFLEAACELPRVVEAILDQNPVFYLDAHTSGIFMRFLRFPKGFEFLESNFYVENELEQWFQFGIFNYVTRIELILDELCSRAVDASTVSTSIFPLHFYGELAKTEQGVAYLAESSHFDVFSSIIRENDQSSTDKLICLKACLWAVAHIGSSSTGITFLRKSKIIAEIVRIASSSKVLSLRGAMQMDPWDFQVVWPSVKNNGLSFGRLDQIEQDIVKNIGTLSNHIVAKQASKQLAKLRQDQAQYFTKVSLYVCVMKMMAQMHFRLTVRRFIHDLFDKVVFDEVVFDEWLAVQ
ncbi:hypothetical protein HDU82_005063 [Entophlyctis luteolus]|nr:hypothetical protein HDU82_005063 [Entophlyctis luteolus]